MQVPICTDVYIRVYLCANVLESNNTGIMVVEPYHSTRCCFPSSPSSSNWHCQLLLLHHVTWRSLIHSRVPFPCSTILLLCHYPSMLILWAGSKFRSWCSSYSSNRLPFLPILMTHLLFLAFIAVDAGYLTMVVDCSDLKRGGEGRMRIGGGMTTSAALGCCCFFVFLCPSTALAVKVWFDTKMHRICTENYRSYSQVHFYIFSTCRH